MNERRENKCNEQVSKAWVREEGVLIARVNICNAPTNPSTNIGHREKGETRANKREFCLETTAEETKRKNK